MGGLQLGWGKWGKERSIIGEGRVLKEFCLNFLKTFLGNIDRKNLSFNQVLREIVSSRSHTFLPRASPKKTRGILCPLLKPHIYKCKYWPIG